MTLNFKAPYGVRLFYTTTPAGQPLMEHTHEFFVDLTSPFPPGTEAGDIELKSPDSSNPPFPNFAELYVLKLQPFFATSTTFIRAELWKYATGTNDGTFITVHPIGEPGTAVTGSVAAHQVTMTFRSLEGGIARVQLMETKFSGTGQASFPTGVAEIDDFAATLTGLSSPVIARDGSRLIVANKFSETQNEKLAEKRFRS